LDRMREYLATSPELGEPNAADQPHLLANALEQSGLRIEHYALNINRVASFDDGSGGLALIGHLLRTKIGQQQSLDHIPSCDEILLGPAHDPHER